MGRAINTTVEIKDIVFDDELYPREKYNWKCSYIYSQSMKSGSKFPPIVLAMLNGKKYLVDGKHRIEAHKLNKETKIEAIVHTGWTREQIFIEAIKANSIHGAGLSPYDKRRIALRLKEMKMKDSEISGLIHVPLDKLENFVASRLVNTMTGGEVDASGDIDIAKQIGQAILKSGVKHLSGMTLEEEDLLDINAIQQKLYSGSQVSLLNEFINLLEKDLLNKDNKEVMKRIQKIKSLLKNY